MFRIRKSDLDHSQSTFVLDSVNILAERDSPAENSVFLSDLKHILDSRFGGDWNLLIGKSVGFAMKTRRKASIVLGKTSGELLLCWRSPGFEVEDIDMVKIKAKLSLEGKDSLLEDNTDVKSLNIIRVPDADAGDYTPQTPEAIKIVQALSRTLYDMEHDAAARHIRSQYVFASSHFDSFQLSLTARLGTIWHVAVGKTGEFTSLPARNCTDHLMFSTKKGVKIVLFRHKSVETNRLALPSMQTVMEVLPTVLFVLLCVAFLVQKSAICVADAKELNVLTKGLCFITTSYSLTPLALLLFVMTIVKQVKKSIDQKRAKRQKRA
jgi:hypothetical protein